MDAKHQIICGDCLEVIPNLPKATTIFADPPDNIGAKYKGYKDNLSQREYYNLLSSIFLRTYGKYNHLWLSFNRAYLPMIVECSRKCSNYKRRIFIWHYTFGQHRSTDCGNGYRPILRVMRPGAKLYPDAIRVSSARQLKYNDKRANPVGKVPDDVWEFPRVCGTFKERKKWHPCQHPKELLRRLVLFTTKPGDLVIDMFAGSGNMLEVCKELDRSCIGIEISKFYCQKIAEETKAELLYVAQVKK